MASTGTYAPPEVNAGTTTSWLALTTAYPSLPGCASAFFRYPGQPVVSCPSYAHLISTFFLRHRARLADVDSADGGITSQRT